MFRAPTIWAPRDMPWDLSAQVVDPDSRQVELNEEKWAFRFSRKAVTPSFLLSLLKTS